MALRDALSADRRARYSGQILKNVTEHACYREAQTLLVYVSFRSEAATLPLIRKALAEEKAVYVPRVAGREMDFFRIAALSDLEEGYRGILEPKAHITDMYTPFASAGKTLFCMPGAVFDRAHHRIGYGGGFYDRYLARLDGAWKGKWKAESNDGLDGEQNGKWNGGGNAGQNEHCTTAALAFACQVMQEIPWQPHDVCPELIVTERGIV